MSKLTLRLLAVIFLAGCSATTMVTSWNDKSATEKKYNKIGVVAITPITENRAIVEEAIANELRKKGLNAFATFNTFPFAGKIGELNLDTALVQRKIRERVNAIGFDGLVTVALLDKQQQQEYVEGTSISIAAPVYDYNYAGYYSYAYGTVYSSGYYKTSSSYFLETNVYDVSTERLIYTAQIKTVDPESISREAPNFANVVVNDIMLKKVLAK